jgi:hypothetical protein
LRNDVRDTGVDDEQVGAANGVRGQESVDLLLDCRGCAVTHVVGLGDHARVPHGIGGPALGRGSERQPETERDLLRPVVEQPVVDGVARAILADISEAVAERDDACGRQLRLDGARAARGQQEGSGASRQQQAAAQPVS